MKIPHILVNSATVLHILPILVNSAMLVNSASVNMQYYEYFAYTNGDVTGVQGPKNSSFPQDVKLLKKEH